MRNNEKPLPELLAPAGTRLALEAAIEAGADAVYFGGPAFNARMRAQNFTNEAMRDSIALCHAYGVKTYLTLNTLVSDRELPALLEAAAKARAAGADALIVADLGAAAVIHRYLPDMELHASTQASGHSIGAAEELRSLGFTRMVLAREASKENMRRFTAECGMETEVFVHGALCVSHSGQCLFSSLVGGRSGNRGECAQPCRLPDKSGKYPLSLKDLTLARHVPALIDMGVRSLKIEGRLKAPEYVRDVVAIWRRLLDERRAATDAEMKALADIFSRGGFTDAYFTGNVTSKMLGVRSDADKANSRVAKPFEGLSRKVPIKLDFTMKSGAPITLSITASGKTVTVAGDVPMVAQNAPMDEAAVTKNLCRFGNTPYTVGELSLALDKGLMIPVSRLNALRRAAIEALVGEARPEALPPVYHAIKQDKVAVPRSARFLRAADVPQGALSYFTYRYLPLNDFDPTVANGVVLPPVIFDDECASVLTALKNAVKRGAKYALVGNVGHLRLAKKAGLVPHGDFRLNATNTESVRALLDMGFAHVLLSPELTLPQIRDIGGATDAIVYGRIPLMILEKCAGREVGGCEACASGKNALVDRRGERFPVLREGASHRSVILNSRPTVMSDRAEALRAANITGGHFIFTTESKAEISRIISDYQNGTAPAGACRRI